jgi:hypothetical protein
MEKAKESDSEHSELSVYNPRQDLQRPPQINDFTFLPPGRIICLLKYAFKQPFVPNSTGAHSDIEWEQFFNNNKI